MDVSGHDLEEVDRKIRTMNVVLSRLVTNGD